MSLVSVYDALKAASVGAAKAYILASALALSLAGCVGERLSPIYVEVLIDAPKKGTPFIVLDSFGNSVAEGKTPEKLALDKNYFVRGPTYGYYSRRPAFYSSEYTIVYTMPDGKKHGQAVYVDKKNRVMLNTRQ